jgi:AcrR family transcriptional regulator
MPYRSSEKTRQKKESKRTAMMQAALKVFSEKGYHAATVRDVVSAADVAIGTFYFYFPDKETLFLYLYEETADFLVQTIRQAVAGRKSVPEKFAAAVQTYLNLALYEPAMVNLLLVGGVGALPSLGEKRAAFRERMTAVWHHILEQADDQGVIAPQNRQRTAEFISGGCDEVVINLLAQPTPDSSAAHEALLGLMLRSSGYMETAA